MSYVMARKQGCDSWFAVRMPIGRGMITLKRELTALGVECVTVNRPSAWPEYSPCEIVETEELLKQRLSE